MGTNLSGSLETEVEIKASGDEFYHAWRSKAHQVPGMTPANLHAVKVHQGDWHIHGSLLNWDYTVDGVKGSWKHKLEFDDEKRCVRFIGVGGDMFKDYKKFIPTYTLYPKSDGTGTFARLQVEYEKRNDDVPAPTKYMDVLITLTKDVDAALSN